MRPHSTFLLVLPTIMLFAGSTFAQQKDPAEQQQLRQKIEHLRQLADSIQREAQKLETDLNRHLPGFAGSITGWGKAFLDSLPNWTKEFSDSVFGKFQFNMPFFAPVPGPNEMPQWNPPQYRYPRYFNDPDLPGEPMPDIEPRGRNIEPLPRVIPKRRDGNEIPAFPGWRIEKLKNLT